MCRKAYTFNTSSLESSLANYASKLCTTQAPFTFNWHPAATGTNDVDTPRKIFLAKSFALAKDWK